MNPIALPTVALRPMTAATFKTYLEWSIPDYAEECVRAGNFPAEAALRMAEEQFQQLLPRGLDTPQQYLFTIHDTAQDTTVGYLWFGVRGDGDQPFAALYDLMVFPSERRRGYGMQALRALEMRVQDLRLSTIRLHVFGHNSSARALYEKMGYIVTNITMAKSLLASTP
ncbi:MAG TPA: GNAT family N-acetyltransferase [Anaerolineae bacterium]|nr:GNAT family N-acetyltransferase [Anaerolineae bacterium]